MRREALIATVVLSALLIGLPLLVIGLGAVGLWGWLVGVTVLPLAVLVTLLVLARRGP